MTSLVYRHVRNVSRTLTCRPDITDLLLVRVDERRSSRVEELLVELCGENVHPLFISDVWECAGYRISCASFQ